MKTIPAILCVCAAYVFSATTVWATDDTGARRVQGVVSCASYADGRASPLKVDWRYLSMGWIAGYITGYNLLAGDTYSILGSRSMDEVLVWMDEWCRANPLKTLDDGMLALLREAYPGRQKTLKDVPH